jgi:hypothetical protein
MNISRIIQVYNKLIDTVVDGTTHSKRRKSMKRPKRTLRICTALFCAVGLSSGAALAVAMDPPKMPTSMQFERASQLETASIERPKSTAVQRLSAVEDPSQIDIRVGQAFLYLLDALDAQQIATVTTALDAQRQSTLENSAQQKRLVQQLQLAKDDSLMSEEQYAELCQKAAANVVERQTTLFNTRHQINTLLTTEQRNNPEILVSVEFLIQLSAHVDQPKDNARSRTDQAERAQTSSEQTRQQHPREISQNSQDRPQNVNESRSIDNQHRPGSQSELTQPNHTQPPRYSDARIPPADDDSREIEVPAFENSSSPR